MCSLFISSTTFIEDGQQVLTWRDSLGDKYSDLPGVCKLHNFIVKTHNGNVVMREKCFTGDEEGRIHHFVSVSALQMVPATKYSVSHLHSISAEKVPNMVTMYDHFIPPDCRPDCHH